MIETVDALREALAGSPLAERDALELPVLDGREKALAIDATPASALEDWHQARARLDQTGRWPLLTTSWNGGSSFAARVEGADCFSRFYFEEAPDAADVSPRSILDRSRPVDPFAFVEALAAEVLEYEESEEPVESILDLEIEQTARAVGAAPGRAEVLAAEPKTRFELDRWLLDWELAHGGVRNPGSFRPEWFEPDHVFLLLLPTASGWESLAYLNWYGTSDFGSESYIALGRSWQRRFGAELVAHYGTMLQCLVGDPPSDARAAWTVAREHDLAGPCTIGLSGDALRHYAQALVGHERWFLHDRP